MSALIAKMAWCPAQQKALSWSLSLFPGHSAVPAGTPVLWILVPELRVLCHLSGMLLPIEGSEQVAGLAAEDADLFLSETPGGAGTGLPTVFRG